MLMKHVKKNIIGILMKVLKKKQCNQNVDENVEKEKKM